LTAEKHLKKQSYINAVITDLINGQNFIPDREAQGQYHLGGTGTGLERRDISRYNMLAITDGDLITPYALRSEIEAGLRKVESRKTNRFEKAVLTFILVYTNSPEPGAVYILNKYKEELRNGSLSVFIVELGKKAVSLQNTGDDEEIYEILKARLVSELEGYENLGDLEQADPAKFHGTSIKEVTNRPAATYALVIINVAVFVIGWFTQVIKGENILINLGSKSWMDILNGQYWRLVTPIFLHAGIAHLATNSFSLVIFGRTVEKIFGSRKFIIIYIAAGIMGNIASFAFSMSDSLGASGAILGIGGALLYLWSRNKDFFAMKRQQYMALVFLVIFNLLYGFTQMNIDNYAHLGGAICGFLMAGILGYGGFKETVRKRFIYGGILIFLAAAGTVLGFTA
jgi:rhomboid protease GluP